MKLFSTLPGVVGAWVTSGVAVGVTLGLFSTLPGVVGAWVTSGVAVGVTLGVEDGAPAKQTNK